MRIDNKTKIEFNTFKENCLYKKFWKRLGNIWYYLFTLRANNYKIKRIEIY